MKIVLAVHHFPPRHHGGSEQSVRGLAHHLVALGHDVRVVCVDTVREAGTAEVAHRDELHEGLPVTRLRVTSRAGDFVSKYAHAEIGAWFDRYLRREQPAVVHLHSGYLLTASVVAAAARAAVPAVITLHDYWFLCPRTTLLRPGRGPCGVPEDAAECAWCLALDKRRFRLVPGAASPTGWSVGARLARRPWVRRLGIHPDGEAIRRRRDTLREAIEQAAAVLVPTRFLRDTFVAAGFPGERFEWVPLGVDRPPVAARQRADAARRFAYLGQIVPHKGVDVLVRAWAHLAARRPAPRLTIHGDLKADPVYVGRLRALAAGNSAIELAGPFGRDRLGDVLAAADAVIVPSLWYENGSQVAREALAAGVPVLASRIGALPELVEDGVDGLLFPAGDVRELVRTVNRVLDEPDLLARLRASLRPPPGGAAEARSVAAIYARVAAVGREGGGA